MFIKRDVRLAMTKLLIGKLSWDVWGNFIKGNSRSISVAYFYQRHMDYLIVWYVSFHRLAS
jgi:hypothetical protein